MILDVDCAINVALIAGEAITNALKHTFPDHRRGAVRVGLHAAGNDVVLSVEDNGIGLPAQGREGSLDMCLIEGMARGLNGALRIDGAQNTRVEVRFPASRSAPATDAGRKNTYRAEILIEPTALSTSI